MPPGDQSSRAFGGPQADRAACDHKGVTSAKSSLVSQGLLVKQVLLVLQVLLVQPGLQDLRELQALLVLLDLLDLLAGVQRDSSARG